MLLVSMAKPPLLCLQALAVSADGQHFAYASSLAVYVFQRQPCQLCKIVSRFDRHVVALAFSPYDPNLLGIVTLDQVLMVGCQLREPPCCGYAAVVLALRMLSTAVARFALCLHSHCLANRAVGHITARRSSEVSARRHCCTSGLRQAPAALHCLRPHRKSGLHNLTSESGRCSPQDCSRHLLHCIASGLTASQEPFPLHILTSESGRCQAAQLHLQARQASACLHTAACKGSGPKTWSGPPHDET